MWSRSSIISLVSLCNATICTSIMYKYSTWVIWLQLASLQGCLAIQEVQLGQALHPHPVYLVLPIVHDEERETQPVIVTIRSTDSYMTSSTTLNCADYLTLNPLGPAYPASPATPGAPGSPGFPRSPWGPLYPRGPPGPRSPFSPCGPGSPGGPWHTWNRLLKQSSYFHLKYQGVFPS